MQHCHGSITEQNTLKFQDFTVIMEEHLRKSNILIPQSIKKIAKEPKKIFYEQFEIHFHRRKFIDPNTLTFEKTMQDLLKDSEESSDIPKMATLIRNVVKEMDDQMPWSAQPSDLDPEKFHMPKYLGQLLQY